MKKISLVLLIGVIFITSSFSFTEDIDAFLDDITITPPKTVSSNGDTLNEIYVGQSVGFSSVLTNHDESEHKFTYLVQILNDKGGTDYLEGLSASFLPDQSFTASQSWIPDRPGKYVVQIFVWESLVSAVPLTDVIQTEITVQ